MRMAKCTGLAAPVTVMGSTETVTIVGPIGVPGDATYHPGWQGDLDQVIGASGFTIADGLGPELLKHFAVIPAATPAPVVPVVAPSARRSRSDFTPPAADSRRGGRTDTSASTPNKE